MTRDAINTTRLHKTTLHEITSHKIIKIVSKVWRMLRSDSKPEVDNQNIRWTNLVIAVEIFSFGCDLTKCGFQRVVASPLS